MLLPTKGIEPERALLTIGGKIISLLESPATLSGLWERFSQDSATTNSNAKITFDWFVFALSLLFAIHAIYWNDYGQLARNYVSA